MGYRKLFQLIFLGFLFLFAELASPNGGLRAQQYIAPSDVLQLPREQASIQLLRNNIQRLENTERSMPFVEEMEFRTESDEMDLGRQEYLFRMRFNNRESRRIQERINQSTVQFYELRSTLLAERQESDRYEYLAEWHYLKSELNELAQKQILLEDQLRVEQRMANNATQIDITNILKLEEDLQDLEQDRLQLQLQRDILVQYFMPDANPADWELSDEGWISMESMHIAVQELVRDTQLTTEEQLQQLEVDAAQFEYELELAEQRRFLEFVQAKYAGRNNLTFAREFSFGVGLLLPTKSTNRVDINEAQLEQFDEAFQLAMLKMELEEDVQQALQKFDQIWQSYQLVQKQIAERDYQSTLNTYRQNSGVSPLTLLQLQALIQKQQRNLRRLEEAACFHYLDLLSLRGLLHPDGTINYLSEGWQSFR